MRPRSHPPSIWILFELERTPRLFIDAMTDGEFRRLVDWLESQDNLIERMVEAVRHVLEMEDE